MAKIKFTPAQQSAIDADGGNILVSAAAGSGKTAVLTARVIRLLTKEDPVMADKLVIVTFTTAAASEMRQRIGAKLQELIELDPTNELLQTQQLLLGLAKICTIHSLCSGLIKEHFQLIGLTHDFKIGQKSQLLVLQNDAVNEVLEQHFEQKSEEFLSLFEFTCDKDDKPLSNMIVSIYDFIRSFPYPLEFLDYSLKAYDNCNNLTQTKWYKLIKSHCLFAFEKACELLNAAIELSQEDKVVYPKYSPALYSDFSQIEQAKLSLTADNWDKTVSILNSYEKVRLSSIRGFEDVSLLVKIKALRSDANDIVETIKKQYINITCDEFAQDNELLYPKISLLFCLVREVYEKIEEKKKDKNIIDYADLEHYALKLLVVHENSQNKQTEIAKELSQSYVEIMIDECQDINEVQNLIFKMLSKNEKNLFMVGDVKQSVYRFRKAEPKL
ncbi:MAG: UvrD-helicase domain-containing protein, partial [Oscillospiraceae bacterium]